MIHPTQLCGDCENPLVQDYFINHQIRSNKDPVLKQPGFAGFFWCLRKNPWCPFEVKWPGPNHLGRKSHELNHWSILRTNLFWKLIIYYHFFLPNHGWKWWKITYSMKGKCWRIPPETSTFTMMERVNFLLEIHISHTVWGTFESMMFLSPRWDMLIPYLEDHPI